MGKGNGENLDEAGLDSRALKLATETLTGDIRDLLLNEMKKKSALPWNLCGEKEQQELIDQTTRMALSIVERTVAIVAAGGRRTIRAILKKIAIKDSIRCEIELSKSDEQRHELADATGATVLIVIVDHEKYEGERSPVYPSKDQKTMFDGEA